MTNMENIQMAFKQLISSQYPECELFTEDIIQLSTTGEFLFPIKLKPNENIRWFHYLTHDLNEHTLQMVNKNKDIFECVISHISKNNVTILNIPGTMYEVEEIVTTLDDLDYSALNVETVICLLSNCARVIRFVHSLGFHMKNMSRKNFAVLPSGSVKLASLTAVIDGTSTIDSIFKEGVNEFKKTACGKRILRNSPGSGDNEYCIDAYLFLQMIMRVFTHLHVITPIPDEHATMIKKTIDDLIHSSISGPNPVNPDFLKTSIFGYTETEKMCGNTKRRSS